MAMVQAEGRNQSSARNPKKSFTFRHSLSSFVAFSIS
jgi:hypothetical protein